MICPTPDSVAVGQQIRLYSHKKGFCEWHLDGAQVLGENPDGSFVVAWFTPGAKQVVLVQRGLNGQPSIDKRTIVVT